MGIIIIGKHPDAEVVTITKKSGNVIYAVMDGTEILGIYPKQSHADALLPLIQSGE